MIGGVWKDDKGVWWVNEARFVPDVAKAKDGLAPVVVEKCVRLATQSEIDFFHWLNDGKTDGTGGP